MSFTNKRFDRFPYFDPEVKLSEFRKKFFQDQNKLFNDTNRWPNGMTNNFMTKTESTPFEAKEDGIPIKVIHESSDDRPNSHPNDDKNFDSMSSKSFGSSQSQRSSDTSKSGGSFHSNRSRESTSGEPRVHHIPITVEGRDGSTSSGYTSEGNANTEQPLTRSSSHSSAHSVGSTGQVNTGHNSNQINPSGNTSEAKDKKETISQIPVEIQRKESQRTASPSEESKSKTNGSTQSKFKRKSGPFVTRIPVVNQNECQSQKNANQPIPEGNANNEPQIVSKLDPLEKINQILTDLKKYEEDIKGFEGTAEDKQYRFLDEMLTRFMIKLDTIETDGKEDVRKARKAAVLAVNNCIASLERKVFDKKGDKVETSVKTIQNNEREEPMQTQTTPEESHQHPKTTEEPIDSNQMESQISNTVAEDIKTPNNQTKDNSQQNLNSTETQCLNNKPNESQRKETAV